MKLFAWQPSGHGEVSFFVMAETEEIAKAIVDAEIIKQLDDMSHYDNNKIDSTRRYYEKRHFDGWGTDYYQLTVADVGEVIMNDND